MTEAQNWWSGFLTFDASRVLLANGDWYDINAGTLRLQAGLFEFVSGTTRYSGPASSVLAVEHSDSRVGTHQERLLPPGS